MVFWLLQSLEAHPSLASGQSPPGLLAPVEHDQFARFTSPVRRAEWLLGRWTAKRLLQQVAQKHCGVEISLETIVIETKENDAPFTDLKEPCTGKGFNLSISHSQGYALCAVTEGTETPLGADIEVIVSRGDDFLHRFFAEGEQELIRKSTLPDTHATAIWSAKESALKASGVGLRIDPRCVSCLVQPLPGPPQDWVPFPIIWDNETYAPQTLPRLTGWWQVLGDFVLTLATPS